MKLFLVSVRALILALVSVVVFGCASSQPTRYVKIAGSGTNQVLVPVQAQKAPSKWKIWNSGGVKGEYVLAPADPIPSRYMPPNPVKNRSGSFNHGTRISSSYSQGTVNSSSHRWDQNGPSTQLQQSTWRSGYYHQEPDTRGVYRNYRDFEAAPAQPLQPIR